MKTFTELVTEIKKGFDKEDNSVLANLEDNIELTSTAALPHAVGTYLVYNKVIYRVTAAIATGDTLTPGTNITVASDIMSMIAAMGESLEDVEECIAPVESTTTASRAYATGEKFIKNHTLYQAKTAIAANDTLVLNTNYEAADNVETQIEAVKTAIANEATARANADTAMTTDILELQNLVGVDESNPSILGLQIDFQNKTYTRLAAAAGLSAGSDFDTFPEFGGRKRCNVADNGTVNAYYGDSSYKEDGSNGQVMVEQPAFYYRVQPLKLEKNTTTGIGYHLRKANYYVSHIPHPGFKLHPAFYDKDGNAVSKIYIGAYEACLYDVSGNAYNTTDAQTMDNEADKLSSIANAKPASGLTQDFTRVKAEQMAQNRGTIWHGQTAKTVAATQLLAMIEYATPNMQTAIGMGVVSKTDDGSTNMANNTGATASLGNASGRQSGTDGLTSVTYRGEENAWGNIWKFVYGINIYGNGSMGGGEPYICKDFNFAESKNDDNYDGAGFTITNAGGYISAFGYGKEEYDWLMMCSEASGNDALPVGDYAWLTANLNGYRIARLGATWGNGLKAGLFCWYVNDGVGYRSRAVGARLVCIPTE